MCYYMHMETDTRKIVQRLKREGWVLRRHGGKHEMYVHPGRNLQVSVARHRTVSTSVARSIAQVAGWT